MSGYPRVCQGIVGCVRECSGVSGYARVSQGMLGCVRAG